MKPSEIIDKALTEVIPDEKHWTKGGYSKPIDDGKAFCLMGAIGMAANQEAVMQHTDSPEGWEAVNAVAEVVREIKPHALTATEELQKFHPNAFGEAVVTVYNDGKERTYDEVCAVLEKARAGLQEKGR